MRTLATTRTSKTSTTEEKISILPGCKGLWFGDDYTTGSWVGRVGPTLTNATPAQQPTKVLSDLNTHASVSFDGGDILTSPTTIDLSSYSSFTLAIVMIDTVSSMATTIPIEFGPNTNTTPGGFAIYTNNGTANTIHFAHQGSTSGSNARFMSGNNANYSILTVNFDLALPYTTEFSPSVNGIKQTILGGGSINCIGNYGNLNLNVGARNGLVAPFIGKIVAIGLFASKLNDSNLALLQSYLSTYTAITLPQPIVPTTPLVSWLDWNSNTVANTQPVLVDGDMEAAGVAAWVLAAGVRTKEINPRSGSQCLRVTCDSAGVIPFTVQMGILIVGNNYYTDGWMRSDIFNSNVRVYIGASTLISNSTISTWTYFSGNGICSGDGRFMPYVLTTTVGRYGEFDDLTVSNLSINSWTPRSGTTVNALTQATAAAMPWKNNGILFDGTDYIVSTAAAGTYSLLHSITGCDLYAAVTISALSGVHVIAATLQTVADYGIAFTLVTGGIIRLYIANNTTYEQIDSAAGVITTSKYLLELHIKTGTVSFVVNGIEVLSTAATKLSATIGTRVLSIGADPAAGSKFYGTIYDVAIFSPLTETEKMQARLYFAQKNDITL